MHNTSHNFRRGSISLAFFFILLLGLAACGPSTGPSAIPSGTAEPAEDGPFAAPVDSASLFAASSNESVESQEQATAVPGSSGGEVDANGLPVGFTADGHPYRGNPDATVIIEEFSDFQCPYCSRFANETLTQLNENQIAAGDVLFVYYDYPLSNIHPQAEVAANAARCAADQGASAYWAMHDLLFNQPQAWSHNQANDTFITFAESLGLDSEQFADCVQSGKHLKAIQDDVDLGLSRGVSSTPSFFINEQPLIGAQPIDVFNQAIATVKRGEELVFNQPSNEIPPTPTPAAISDEGIAATLGSADAPYTIVEFTDFSCAACARYATETLPTLQELLVDSDQVHYILKDFPQSEHPEARQAAIAARCAGEQEAYWPMYQALFASQAEWVGQGDKTAVFFKNLAADLGLDTAAFEACQSSGQFDAAIQAGISEGEALNVGELPYFFVEGYPLSGAEPNSVALALGLPMDVSIEGAYSIGDPNAPITIIEFTDYQCPYCERHFTETLPSLMADYVETGKVHYVFKDFPLTAIHPQAQLAAEAARCAGAQDAYVPMHDALFANQASWSGQANAADLFEQYAADLGLDSDAFRACLDSGEMKTAVLTDQAQGFEYGVNGTPAFFVNGFLISGALPYSSFDQALTGMLDEMQQ
ncbi:MAG: thioredoxin domain-containing protein [Ardenticatenaceae bacterium]|nr:thioredoxin domain-containing protein [Ardenticatenaceae bacterium]MCB8986554.1 thioredoxin domain-containing protein [Ardenticatenaceae bacterium]